MEINENGLIAQQRAKQYQRSEALQDIVSNRPGFFVRRGTAMIFILLIVVTGVSWFIKYPDIIETSARLTSINAPKPVVTRKGGKLTALTVKESEEVKKGQVLGTIESTADHAVVITLSNTIDSIAGIMNSGRIAELPVHLGRVFSNLGELQVQYQVFLDSWRGYKGYLDKGFYLRKRTMLLRDMAVLQSLHMVLLEQKGLQQQDLDLTQKTIDADQELNKEKILSEFDYRNEQSKLLNKKLSLPQVNALLVSNEGQQNDKQKEIAELENSIAQQESIFRQAMETFRSQISDWKRDYLLVAPIEGKVQFANFLQVNQQLQVSQTVCFINPENTQYFMQVNIPQYNFGKVAVGQTVLLKLSSYQYQEYGYLKGTVTFISHIATDSGYMAKVSLPDKMHTTYQKEIPYQDGLTANAEIITRDMRLLQRLYFSLLKAVKR
jgi:multidrug efflux pump subunit AcrA (membrane-fusion protein)